MDNIFEVGVCYADTTGLWFVFFKKNRIQQSVGFFETFEEVAEVVQNWCLEGKE